VEDLELPGGFQLGLFSGGKGIGTHVFLRVAQVWALCQPWHRAAAPLTWQGAPERPGAKGWASSSCVLSSGVSV
jgi:hypothetical protein